ncbi:MAG: MotA/TolQ/ExbB proton channel family protein [Chitinophagaceae bacterium]|nr:MotA/TolQ/ExbB proton channel family protein [Chitinophagaceae bacterium]
MTKRVILSVLVFSVFLWQGITMAQDSTSASSDTTKISVSDDLTSVSAEPSTIDGESTSASNEEEASFHQQLKEQFIAGGVEWMTPILICLIVGLGICIERIIVLNLSTTNTKKLLGKIEKALEARGDVGIEQAKEVCKNTAGPVASIFFQGLLRSSEGIDMVEKSIVSYGGVEMGKLEKGLVWVSLFIALAPMLGFLGTVVGMVLTFQAIAVAGDVSPSVLAGGMNVALLTTIGGLIVAIILQMFYNYIVSKVDSISNSMEDASINLVDILIKHKLSK